MPTIRLIGFFKDDDGHGWSEAHDKDGGSSITSLTTYIANFNSLMQTFRRPLLAGDAYYLGCRASYRTASGNIAGDNKFLDPPLRGVQTLGGASIEMGAPETAVKMRMRNDASTARSDVYLRGGPKELATAGILNLGGAIGNEWKTRLDEFAAELVAKNYGWVGVNPATTSRGNVTGYTQGVDGTVTLTVAATNAIALPADGTKMLVNFARINDSNSVLNRGLVVTIQGAGAQMKTVQQISVGDFESAGTYIATVKGFIPYAALSYYRLGKRKTGRPFGVGPGRLPARALT